MTFENFRVAIGEKARHLKFSIRLNETDESKIENGDFQKENI